MIKLNGESIIRVLPNFHCYQYIRHYINEAEIRRIASKKIEILSEISRISDWIFMRCECGQRL